MRVPCALIAVCGLATEADKFAFIEGLGLCTPSFFAGTIDDESIHLVGLSGATGIARQDRH